MTEHNWKHDTMIDVEAMVKKRRPFSSFDRQFIGGFFCLQSNRIINGERQKLFHLP